MSSNDEENQTKADETKKATANVSSDETVATQKDATPPKTAKTDNLLNFSLTEASKNKDEKKKEDDGG